MAPKGLYSVQKSRSFGGSNNFQHTPPKETCLSPEPGRKTPNFDSLRKKFSRKKTTSFDDDDGDFADGTTLTLKKKGRGHSKVGHIFNKLFRKDSKDHEPIYEHDNLTPKIKRLIQKQNEEPRVISVNPRPFRSNSFDSICSVGSAASSFAFVPVTAYKVGKYVEPKKKIAIGINCGPETYRKRQEQRDMIYETDRELTLKTKYNLMSSDSPPSLARRLLPSGPLLQSSDLHRNDDTNSSSGGESDTDTMEELGSISQRCSPSRQSSGPSASAGPALVLAALTQVSCADQQRGKGNKNTADNYKNTASPVPAQSIKPRELTGQLLYPMTIRPSEENKRNGLGSHSSSENGTLKPSRQPYNFAQPSQCANNSGRDFENLPKFVTAETIQSVSVCHSPQSSSYQFCPRQDSPLSSPRHSFSSDDNKPGLHIPGKRRAPAPPARTRTPDTGGGAQRTEADDCLNPFLKRKGRAPQPPGDKAETEDRGDRGESCAANGGQCQPQEAGQLAVGQVNTGSCVGTASAAAQSDSGAPRQGMMSGSAPTSPLLAKKYPPGCQPPDEWVIRDGLLKCIRESQQDLTEEKEKESKDSKAPLSPKPWYKRNLIKENSNKKQKDKKAKSPDNLPDNHTSRDAFKVIEVEKRDISKAAMIRQEAPKSPKMFLRSKLMPGSPKAERPSSRPISGLTGISDLDRQAAEIIRRKNEEDAAKKKAGDEKFYASKVESEGMDAQKAIDGLMDKMSKKFTRLEGISKINNEWVYQLQNEEKTTCDLFASPTKDSDIEDDFQSMGNVVSDLNSFLVSTRKAMSSPSTQNRHQKPLSTAEQQSCKNLPTYNDNTFSPHTICMEQQLQQPPLKMFKELEKSQDVKVKMINNNNISRNNFLSENSESVSHSSSGNKSVGEQKQTIKTNTLSDADQNVNYFPAEQKTHYPPPPPECPRSDMGWSCHRCTLINNNNSVCCEACGARREGPTREQFSHQDLDQESEDAPPKPGNVLNKLVLFSSIDARAKETPSLQRRKSADVNKLSRTYSSTAMFPVVENPLQKTLERITEKQAELAKTKDCFNNNNFSFSKDANTDKCKLGPSSICQETKSNDQTGDLMQQRQVIEKENLNSLKHYELTTNLVPDEKTCSIPFGNVSSTNDNYILNENSGANQNNLIMRSPSVIIPPQSNKEIENSSLKGSFDFTRTPGSFLSSSKISQPTPKPWSKFSHNNDTVSVKAAPKLEFLGAEVFRKHSAPTDEDQRITQASSYRPSQDSQRTCQV